MMDEEMGDVGDGDDGAAAAAGGVSAGRTDEVSGGGSSAMGVEGGRNTASELVSPSCFESVFWWACGVRNRGGCRGETFGVSVSIISGFLDPRAIFPPIVCSSEDSTPSIDRAFRT